MQLFTTKKMLCVLFLANILPFAAMAQKDDLRGEMDTVEVKTSRLPQRLSETGRSVTVIKGEMLGKLPITSVDDVLKFVTGIEVQSRNAFGAQADISMRGGTFAQVVVMIDGMRLNDPLTAHFNNYIPITAAEIDRIEVLRGAAAAMFGADAVGGVVHIVTKTMGNPNFEPSRRLVLDGGYGEEKLVRATGGAFIGTERLKVSLGGSVNQSDGQVVPLQIFENSVGDTILLEEYRNYFDLKNATICFSYKINKNWSTTLRTAADLRDFSARYFYSRSTFDKSIEKTFTSWSHFQANRIVNNQRTTIDFAYKYNTDEYIFNPAFTINNHTTQLANFQLNHAQLVSESVSFNIGLQADRRAIESNDRGDHADAHLGVSVVGVYRSPVNLTVTGGLRVDYDENYGLEVLPQFNAAYNFKAWTLRASGGRSIRAADYTERYVSNNLPTLSAGRSLGNPNLNAESSWGAEFGADIYVLPSVRVSATGFSRNASQLIDYVTTNSNDISNNANLTPNTNYFYAQNITDVQTIGSELEIGVTQKIKKSTVNGTLGYLFLNTNNEEGVISVYISNHAKHLVTTQWILTAGKLNLSLNGLLKVRNEQASAAINAKLEKKYTVWNTRIGHDLTKQLEGYLLIHNLFDAEYQDILGAKMPRFWFMGGIRLQLNQ